ncbi:TPA: hypothetical protein U1315_000724 [Streptococcus suis]|nr:hypothetical protein [Streptococcus suis]HEM5139543.1 hypothetical protein [Streptococcus suis]HEM5173274.1 hypothetical protein [Streptococcus suis]HEM5202394.1 hypothetical protein [Streptococcus suis]HEM5220993.1 hypothetical protein [Streptococcus suis]
MTLTAQEAFNHLDPQAWTQVSIAERLEILATIQENMRTYGKNLVRLKIQASNRNCKPFKRP